MKMYKLTDQNNRTYNNTQWGVGICHQTDGIGELCGTGWIHVYSHPLIAVLLNPIHADFKEYNLWEVECDGESKNDNGLKIGFTKVTTTKQINIPKITLTQKIIFGILCARKVYNESGFIKWANNYINNIDRSQKTAKAVYEAVYEAADAAAADAAAAYAVAARAAAAAARADTQTIAVAYAADAAYAAAIAASAAEVARAAAAAARAASAAAYAANGNDINIDLIALAEEVVKD